jgi:hypothetical protein
MSKDDGYIYEGEDGCVGGSRRDWRKTIDVKEPTSSTKVTMEAEAAAMEAANNGMEARGIVQAVFDFLKRNKQFTLDEAETAFVKEINRLKAEDEPNKAGILALENARKAMCQAMGMDQAVNSPA